MPQSDVKLVPGRVRVEALDLCVDSVDRRRRDIPTPPDRRAVVHDCNDGLTINWDGDYPGGVTIKGNTVRVVGKLEITTETFQPQGAGVDTQGSGRLITGRLRGER